MDEIWTFVFKKQARLNGDDNHAERGDQYVFTGMDAETKLIILPSGWQARRNYGVQPRSRPQRALSEPRAINHGWFQALPE